MRQRTRLSVANSTGTSAGQVFCPLLLASARKRSFTLFRTTARKRRLKQKRFSGWPPVVFSSAGEQPKRTAGSGWGAMWICRAWDHFLPGNIIWRKYDIFLTVQEAFVQNSPRNDPAWEGCNGYTGTDPNGSTFRSKSPDWPGRTLVWCLSCAGQRHQGPGRTGTDTCDLALGSRHRRQPL